MIILNTKISVPREIWQIIILFFIVVTGLTSCQKEEPEYSFFTAGHAYGEPDSPHFGLHSPFVDFIPQLNNHPNMELGFFTGDVVSSSTPSHWDSAMADMSQLKMPTHIAAGNHDMSNEFIKRFEKYYYSFHHRDDLFIVLTPGLDEWNISGDQLEFLESTMNTNHLKVKNIFIFLHELIWWSPNNEFKNVKMSSFANYPGSSNYEDVVKPLLSSYSNNIVIYAGDLGSIDKVSPCMYHTDDNITLIASGMGGGIRDNIIITEVFEETIHHRLIALNGDDPQALGELEDFSLEFFEE